MAAFVSNITHGSRSTMDLTLEALGVGCDEPCNDIFAAVGHYRVLLLFCP
jgi:hypothetical protein